MNLRRLMTIIVKNWPRLLRGPGGPSSALSPIAQVIQLVLYGYLSNDVRISSPRSAGISRSDIGKPELIDGVWQHPLFRTDRPRQRHAGHRREHQTMGKPRQPIVIPPDYARAHPLWTPPPRVLVVVDASDATSAHPAIHRGGCGQQLICLKRSRFAPSSATVRCRRPHPAVDIRRRSVVQPGSQIRVFLVPGVLAVILQFTTTFLSISVIVKERELGTFEQLVVTPIKQTELMLGKIVPLIGLGFVNMTFILFWAGCSSTWR